MEYIDKLVKNLETKSREILIDYLSEELRIGNDERGCNHLKQG